MTRQRLLAGHLLFPCVGPSSDSGSGSGYGSGGVVRLGYAAGEALNKKSRALDV